MIFMCKRTISFLCVCVLLLTFVGCGDKVVYPEFQTRTAHAVQDKFDPEPVTFDDLKQQFALVVCADVVATAPDIEVLDRDSNRNECAQLEVREVLKGNAQVGDLLWTQDTSNRRVETDSFGNALDVFENGWSGEPLMKEGNRVVVFLNPIEDKTIEGEVCYTTAPYAKYFLDHDGLYHCSLLYSAFFINCFYYEDDADGVGVVPTDLVPKTLDELKELMSE